MAASVVARTAGALKSDQPPLTPQAEKRAAEGSLGCGIRARHCQYSSRFRYGTGESMARAISGVR